MRKSLNVISAILAAIMLGTTVAVGWYQIAQITDFLPENHNLNDKWCKVDTSNLCTIWPDRFSMIALGVIVPLVLGPFVLVFLNTMSNPLPIKRRLIIWLSIMLVSILVYISGIILCTIL